jgi:hypothetical protein
MILETVVAGRNKVIWCIISRYRKDMLAGLLKQKAKVR